MSVLRDWAFKGLISWAAVADESEDSNEESFHGIYSYLTGLNTHILNYLNMKWDPV